MDSATLPPGAGSKRSAAPIKAFIDEHPLPTYFALTFVVSWGAVFIVVGPNRFLATPDESKRLLAVVYPAMALGPTAVGLALTGLVHGRAGLRAFRSRLMKWRIPRRWYAVALLTAPALVTGVGLALSLLDPKFTPGILTSNDKIIRLLAGVALALAAGLFEELGWTGFALPHMRPRYGMLTTGIILGYLWGAWHFLLFFWGSGNANRDFSPAVFTPTLVSMIGLLPAYRVLMVWAYEHTQSLLLAILMHAGLDAGSFIFAPLATGRPDPTFNLVLTAVVGVAVGAVATASRRRPLQQGRVLEANRGAV